MSCAVVIVVREDGLSESLFSDDVRISLTHTARAILNDKHASETERKEK